MCWARRDCSGAATEIGALGYCYPGRILDLVGLVSPEVTKQPLEAAAHTACWLVSCDTHLPPELMTGSPFISNHSALFRRRVGQDTELLVFRRR
jgi:hypothetical protein